MSERIAGLHAAPEPDEAARAVAGAVGCGLLAHPPASGLYLDWTAHGLALARAQPAGAPLRLIADFRGGRQGWRLREASIRREPLARACGLRGDRETRVADVTAGLGRDGMLLAVLGARVTMVERDPVVAALLADALRRAAAGDDALSRAASRVTLVHEDAMTWLGRAAPPPEVVCIDPMFDGGGRGQVKKDMQLLRALLPPPDDGKALLRTALAAADARVVVKRHRLASPLAGRPDHCIEGRSTRFDVYLTRRGNSTEP